MRPVPGHLDGDTMLEDPQRPDDAGSKPAGCAGLPPFAAQQQPGAKTISALDDRNKIWCCSRPRCQGTVKLWTCRKHQGLEVAVEHGEK
jgi:hypothetical protein